MTVFASGSAGALVVVPAAVTIVVGGSVLGGGWIATVPRSSWDVAAEFGE